MTLPDSRTPFIESIITEHAPQEVLQLGLGSIDSTISVCQALDAIDNSALTLITPTVSQHASALKEINRNEGGLLSELVELIRTPADEVLPDFYFQNRSIDLAIINDIGQYDQALVALYYVDKLLASKGTIIFDQAGSPVIRKLCRYLVMEREYTVQKTLGGTKQDHRLADFLRGQFKRVPGFIRKPVEQILHPDLLMTDDELDMSCSMVALTKPVQEGEIDMDFDTLLESIINESTT